MKKVIYIICLILVVLILLLNILSITNSSLFGFRLFKVMTGSMEPTISTGSLILVKEEKEYKVKDIVTYKNDNEYVTHRIVKIENDEITTKGDNNNTEDKAFSKDKIIGKMIYELKIYGFILYLIKNPITWVLAISIYVIVMLLKKNNKERS